MVCYNSRQREVAVSLLVEFCVEKNCLIMAPEAVYIYTITITFTITITIYYYYHYLRILLLLLLRLLLLLHVLLSMNSNGPVRKGRRVVLDQGGGMPPRVGKGMPPRVGKGYERYTYIYIHLCNICIYVN